MKITQLDLFSGIGGFHLGLERAGFEVESYFSEVDKHAIAVYQNNFKEAKYVGSVTDVRGGDLPNIDIITFGSPCQDFSLAGKRKGMGGERSSLITEAIRLIAECRPSVFVWENVKGTFSSNNGADFWAIIQAFADLGGYRIEWQLLNTSWFLPQNRERIYLVGYSTTPGRDWGGVFPLGESGEQDVKVRQFGDHTRTITTAHSHGTAKHMSYVKVKSATSQVQPNYTYKALNETISRNPEAFKDGEVKAIDYYNKSVRDEAPCLTAPEHNTTRMFDGYRIRRLTPIECERLQGFPDNWTELGIYEGEVKKVSNTRRYKQCGNAVTVDVVAAVAERIKPLFGCG